MFEGGLNVDYFILLLATSIAAGRYHDEVLIAFRRSCPRPFYRNRDACRK